MRCSRYGHVMERHMSELKWIKMATSTDSCSKNTCAQVTRPGRAWRNALELERPDLSRPHRRRLAGASEVG